MNGHLRGPVEPASDRIEKEIGAVEESEIGSGPRDGPIDRVCQIAEGDANGPRRHWQSETTLLLVLELVVHLHDVFDRRARMLGIPIVERLSIDHISLLNGNARSFEHADLLGLAAADRRLSSERVEVIVGERFLRHRRRCRRPIHAHLVRHHLAHDFPHAVQLPGDELELRIAKRCAALIREGHPAVEIAGFVVSGDREDVIGVPRQFAGEIGRFNAMARGAAVLDRPDQRGPRIQRAGQFWKAYVVGSLVMAIY